MKRWICLLFLLHLLPGLEAFTVVTSVARRPSRNYSQRLQASQSAVEEEINQLELKLQQAMLDSDVDALDSLIDDQLLLTNFLGAKMGKQDDLELHRKQLVEIKDLTLSDLQIQILPPSTTAVVTVAAHIVGSFLGDSFEDTLRFTRVWHQDDKGWRVIAVHSSSVVQNS